MGMSNNDFNWRLVAAEQIPENVGVAVDSAGRAEISDGVPCHGICPQLIRAGERCPVMRGGTVSGLTGFTAGTRLYVKASDGTLTSVAGDGPAVAIVKAEDTTTALILTAALDNEV